MRILLLLFLPVIFSCNTNKKWKQSAPVAETVYILPLNNIPDKTKQEIFKKLQLHFPSVQLLPAERIPVSAYNKERKRYRADDILKWLNQRIESNEKIIAISSHDISTSKGSIKDWGVMGLAYRPGRVAVASNFRLKDKNNFYKVVMHELAHTNGLSHCPDRNCYLRDAKGGDHTGNEKSFCKDCTARLVERGWIL